MLSMRVCISFQIAPIGHVRNHTTIISIQMTIDVLPVYHLWYGYYDWKKNCEL